MAARHIAIETWLTNLDLKEYQEVFQKYNGVEELLYMSEADIKDMGVKNSAHRAKLISNLQMLRDKYERMTQGKRGSPLQQIQRSQSATAQLTGSPPSFINSPDYQQAGTLIQEKLQHELLAELQGDPADLKSKAWYHGHISRQGAEGILYKNGDFLVRDCTSQPSDFVLSCFWKGGPLHFLINSKVEEQGQYQLPKVKYHFENVMFDSVQDLIQDYMDECRPITDISGAVITTPVARCMPLSFYDSKYATLPLAQIQQLQKSSHYSNVKIAKANMQQPQVFMGVSPKGSPRTSPLGTPGVSPHGTPGVSPHGSPSSGRRPRVVERAGSQPMLSVNDVLIYAPNHMDRSDSLPIIPGTYQQATPTREVPDHIPPVTEDVYKQVTPSGPPSMNTKTAPRPPTGHFHQRSGSAPVLTPGINVTQHFDLLAPPSLLNPAISDSDLHKPPPPKPSRIPSVKYKAKPVVQIRNAALYEDDYRDYSDYDTVKSEPSWVHSADQNEDEKLYDNSRHGNSQSNHLLPTRDVNQNVHKSDSRKISDTNFNILDGVDYSETPAFPLVLNVKGTQVITDRTQDDLNKPKVKLPKLTMESSFNLHSFKSVLLPNENKLLDPSVLLKVKEVLTNTEAKLLAKYLTKVDLDLLKVVSEEDLGVKVTSGLELITLPQGKQLRQDLLERINMFSVEVLSNLAMRALAHASTVALIRTKAFVKVMVLMCAQVSERATMLSQWIQIAMETRATLGNWFAFENVMEALMSEEIQRLRYTWTTLRQIHTSSAFLFDTKLKSAFRTLHDGSGTLPLEGVSIPGINPIVQLLERAVDDQTYLPWESADINNGLDTMLIHLDVGRLIMSNCDGYKNTGKSRLENLESDSERTEIFGTPFHMHFLWGAKGVGVNCNDRHSKFSQLLKALSLKKQNEEDAGTEV